MYWNFMCVYNLLSVRNFVHMNPCQKTLWKCRAKGANEGWSPLLLNNNHSWLLWCYAERHAFWELTSPTCSMPQDGWALITCYFKISLSITLNLTLSVKKIILRLDILTYISVRKAIPLFLSQVISYVNCLILFLVFFVDIFNNTSVSIAL